MPSFHVRLGVELVLTARNQKEADLRAGDLIVEVKPPPGARWRIPDVETIDVINVDKED